jgi:hypothetical protein
LHPMTGDLRHRNEHLRHRNEHSKTNQKRDFYRNRYENLSILQFLNNQNIQKWSPETDTNGKEENGLWQTLSLNQKEN